jgi:transposase-like protein
VAHHEDEATPIERVLEVLAEHGLGAMAAAMQTLMNEAMKLERSEFLRARPGERTSERIGHANGFKDKTVRSRVGELALKVPQVRPLPDGEAVSFYPRALERGLRSERALKLAIAEMYVQGVSTRRVTEITRELCGLEVTSAQVSRAAAELDAELTAWRERPLGRCRYLVLDARYEKVRHGGAVVDCAVLVGELRHVPRERALRLASLGSGRAHDR